MIHPDCPYGFRVVGPVNEDRRLVDPAVAFLAHCAADSRSKPECEGYLSPFNFGDDFKRYLERLGTTKGFVGACWSPYLWFDVDRIDLADGLAAARRLAFALLERYSAFDEDDLLYFFSGRRGFHIGVPLTHRPAPSVSFNRVSRRLAEGLAAEAGGVVIDPKIYNTVGLLRAPNSTHPQSKLHKRRLTHEELLHLSPEGVVRLARDPHEFDVLAVAARPAALADDWTHAEMAICDSPTGRTTGSPPIKYRLQRDTLQFIRRGAEEGERNHRLFRAAGNLREHDTPLAVIQDLLTEPALDSGLTPAEVARTIVSGIENSERKAKGETR
jgi:hypothetical protein